MVRLSDESQLAPHHVCTCIFHMWLMQRHTVVTIMPVVTTAPVCMLVNFYTNLLDLRFVFCRAEATDVANAVLDGVDCIMLGAETLRGKHPVATVETILHICKQAEKVFDHNYHFETLMRVSLAPPLALLSPSCQSSYTFCLWKKRKD